MGFISRQIIEAYKKVLFVRHDPDGTLLHFDHNDFEGLYRENFNFYSQKGHLLKGGFYFYDNPKEDLLIVFEHGLSNGHRAYMREIEKLCSMGYKVFSYDHTGSDTSEGSDVMGLSGSLPDLDDCLNALKKVPEISKMKFSVIGHSRGGFSAMNILAYHPDIHSVIAMSGYYSLSSMLSQIVPSILFSYKKHLFQLEEKTNPRYVNNSAISVLGNTNKPVMIIHSLDDKTVSAKKNFIKLKKLLKEKKNIKFILLKGKDHNPTYTVEAVKYKRKCFAELKQLKKRGLLSTNEQKNSFVKSYDWFKMTEQDSDLWKEIALFLEK